MQKTFYVHSTKHNDNHFNQTTNLNTLEKGIKTTKNRTNKGQSVLKFQLSLESCTKQHTNMHKIYKSDRL